MRFTDNAPGKLCSKPTLSTLKACNNTYTTNMQSTINWLMDRYVPEDEYSDGVHHKRVRQQTMEPLHTTDDVAFMKQEIQAVLENFDLRKAPGEDALNSEVLLHTFRSFPTFFTDVRVHRKRTLPNTMETFHITTHSETGKGGAQQSPQIPPYQSNKHRW
jgi:hypothetical protein